MMKRPWIWGILLLPGLLLAGCNDDNTNGGGTGPGDVTPPDAISNLEITDMDEDSATLAWTATGDDGQTGTASSYSIRYSRDPITSANWPLATAVTTPPAPAGPGTGETLTVTGLQELTPYYFAVKTADEVPNWSPLSNVVMDTTLGERSLIVINSRAGQYAILDPTTGMDSVEVAPAVHFVGETTLGFEAHHVILRSPIGPGGGNNALYVMDTWDGANVTKITDDAALNVVSLDGSPKEAKIAFGAHDAEFNLPHVYTVNEDGTDQAQLTTQDEALATSASASAKIVGAGNPIWSPDGTLIAFDVGLRTVPQNHAYNGIAVMNADGSGKQTLYDQNVEEAHYDDLCWTPDGNYIVFKQVNNVKALSVATGQVYDLTAGLDVGDPVIEMVTTSPYDMTLAFGNRYLDGELYIVDLQVSGDAISVAGTPTKLTDQLAVGHAYTEPDWAPWVPEW